MQKRTARFRMPGRDLIGPVFLVCMLFAGYVKGTAAFAWLPVDLTMVAAAVTLLVVVLVFLRRLSAPRNAVVVVLLWLSFVPASPFHGPASPFHDANPYAGEKVLKLWTLTLLAALAPFFVVDTPRRRMVAAWTVVGFGFACTATAVLFPDPLQSWRLVAQGSNTIAVGRAAGAACLILAILGFFVRRRLLRAVLFVGALGWPRPSSSPAPAAPCSPPPRRSCSSAAAAPPGRAAAGPGSSRSSPRSRSRCGG